MYSVTVSAGFQATHNIRLHDGSAEPVHAHVWNVQARFCGTVLDARDLLIDFGLAQATLHQIVGALAGSHLNDCPELQGANPTAERVACLIFERLGSELGLCACLDAVTVTEAPGCAATYQRDS